MPWEQLGEDEVWTLVPDLTTVGGEDLEAVLARIGALELNDAQQDLILVDHEGRIAYLETNPFGGSGGGGGIPEPPIDSNVYGRQSGGWIALTTAFLDGLAMATQAELNTQITRINALEALPAGLPEVPSGANQYVRTNGGWIAVDTAYLDGKAMATQAELNTEKARIDLIIATPPSGVPEPPVGANNYARTNGAWTLINQAWLDGLGMATQAELDTEKTRITALESAPAAGVTSTSVTSVVGQQVLMDGTTGKIIKTSGYLPNSATAGEINRQAFNAVLVAGGANAVALDALIESIITRIFATSTKVNPGEAVIRRLDGLDYDGVALSTNFTATAAEILAGTANRQIESAPLSALYSNNFASITGSTINFNFTSSIKGKITPAGTLTVAAPTGITAGHVGRFASLEIITGASQPVITWNSAITFGDKAVPAFSATPGKVKLIYLYFYSTTQIFAGEGSTIFL